MRKELQRLMGLLNWLRSFIPDFATVTAPITDLLSPKMKYRWTAEADHALAAIKSLFQKSHVLSHIAPGEPLYLQTDTSKVGMGAVLYQVGPDGEQRVLEYTSSKFGPAARNNDHPDPTNVYEDEGSWEDLVPPQGHSSSIGKSSGCAALYMVTHQLKNPSPKQVDTLSNLISAVQQVQRGVAATKDAVEVCGTQVLPYQRVVDGVLQSRAPADMELWRIYAPEEARAAILVYFHDHQIAGHPSREQMAEVLRTEFHWPGVTRDIREYMGRCLHCQHCKARRSDGEE
ncbi:uncharacterized protein LOC134535242 [Bacillus rossius redtenbacheri]|uniref:uncharacterized protein LOC134535242 n=1 Tax=Bacillus rossius redtenbacheri TaxID=93214 RepID=UPI002FDE276D